MFIDQATIRVKAGDGGTSVYAEPEHSEGEGSRRLGGARILSCASSLPSPIRSPEAVPRAERSAPGSDSGGRGRNHVCHRVERSVRA